MDNLYNYILSPLNLQLFPPSLVCETHEVRKGKENEEEEGEREEGKGDEEEGKEEGESE